MPRVCPDCGARFDTNVQTCPRDGSPTYRIGLDQEMVGRKIDGRFVLTAIIGSGGMGAVYRARQLSTDRDVAIKLLRRDIMDDETAVRRFFREARTASRLTNPHTISVYDFGQDEDGSFYIAMELLRGKPLAFLLADPDRRPGPDRAVMYCIQVLESLEEAHGAGVLHRDLKPDNIFVLDNPPDFVKVLDFGIAKLQSDDEPRVTSEDQAIGTPEYMSPEQASGKPVDGRSDLYALGVVLFEMLSGRLPFEGDAAIDLLLRKVREPAPAVSALVPDVPSAIDAVVGRLLQTDPGRRPSSAREARALLRHAIGLPVTGPVPIVGRCEPSGMTTVPRGTVRGGLPDADRVLRVLDAASRLLAEGKALYARSSVECGSLPARNLFSMLAGEAVAHLERLRPIRDRVEAGRDPSPEIESIAATDRDLGGQFERWVIAYAPSIREDDAFPDALDAGLAFERRALDAWEAALPGARDEFERRLLQRLLVRGKGQVATLAELKLRVIGVRRGGAAGSLHTLLAGLLPVRTVRAGEVLVREGEPGDTLVVVVSGRFRVEVGGPGGARSEIGEIGEGDMVGEMTCIDPAPRSATVVATRDSVVCEVDRATLNGLLASQPSVYVSVMRGVIAQVTARVRETDARIAALIRQLRVQPGASPSPAGMSPPGDDRSESSRPPSVSRSLVARFAEVGMSRSFIDRTVVCREGEPGRSCFLIAKGQVEVFKNVDGHEETLAVLPEGSLVGQIALVDGRPRTASVRARGYVVAIELSREAFDRLVDRYDPLALSLLDMLAVNGIRQLRVADRWLAMLLARHDDMVACRGLDTPEAQQARAAVAFAARRVSGARPRDDDEAARRLGAYMRAALREWGMSMQQLDEVRVVVPGDRPLATDVRSRPLRVD